MKKILMMILVCVCGIQLIACSSETDNATSNQTENQQEQNVEEKPVIDASNMLIAYFTYGENAQLSNDVDASSSASIQIVDDKVTGNTGVLAHMISDSTGADLFSIQTQQPYPDNYDATVTQGQEENRDGARPELATHIENFDTYDTIFIGFPNWWYDMPMALYTFFEEYDFSDKTIIPFSTSGGSGFSSTIETIQELEPNAQVLEGITINGNDVTDAEEDINEWLSSLGYEN